MSNISNMYVYSLTFVNNIIPDIMYSRECKILDLFQYTFPPKKPMLLSLTILTPNPNEIANRDKQKSILSVSSTSRLPITYAPITIQVLTATHNENNALFLIISIVV